MTHKNLGNSSNYLNFNIIISDYFKIWIIINNLYIIKYSRYYILINYLCIYIVNKYINVCYILLNIES